MTKQLTVVVVEPSTSRVSCLSFSSWREVVSMNRCVQPHELVQPRSAGVEVGTSDASGPLSVAASSGRNKAPDIRFSL